MKLGTRISIVAFTLGSCLFAAYLEREERFTRDTQAPFVLFDAVQGQLSAIRAQRYQEAYFKASTQYMVDTDFDLFIQKARGCDAVLRQAVRWEFGIPSISGENAEVPVHFFLPGGDVIPASYALIRENRTWKIDDIQIADALPPRSAAGVRL